MAKTKVTVERLDRWRTLNLFIANGLADLARETRSSSAGVVWFVLFGLANGRTGLVHGTSIKRLARLTNLDRVTVRRAVNVLLKAGHLSVHDRAGVVPVYHLEHVVAEADEPE